jgi:hypothetical protein
MLHVLTKDGKKLFSGTKHQVKQFIRKNNVKSYVLKERFVEKVAVLPEPDNANPLSEPETPEGFFNKIFDDE